MRKQSKNLPQRLPSYLVILMEKYLIETIQKNPQNPSVTKTEATLDWDNREFEECSKVTFSDGFSYESKSTLRENVLYLDEEPIESASQNWLNASGNLIGLTVATHYHSSLTGLENSIHGKVQELNEICENQLNLPALGENSTYTINIDNLSSGKLSKISLTVFDSDGKVLMEQTTVPV